MNSLLSISFRVTTGEYAKFLFVAMYKRPAVIFMGIAGLYSLIMNLVYDYTEGAYLTIPYALGLILYPLLVVGILLAQRRKSPLLTQELLFEFREDGIHIKGEDFKSDLAWSHILQVKEVAGFLVLKPSRREGYLVKKAVLTKEEITYIREKVAAAKQEKAAAVR